MKIPQNIIEELIVQARKDAPNESCGYLLGIVPLPQEKSGEVFEAVVTENYWMENIDHSSEHFVLLTVLFNLLVLALMAATVYLFVKLYKKR